MINRIKSNEIIIALSSFFEKQKEQAYIVGGFVRDSVLGLSSDDVDVVVGMGKANCLAQKFADTINGYFVELDSVNHIYRVVFSDKHSYVDIADCVGSSIQEDLKRRDFTVNALAYDIVNENIIDVCGGLDDIQKCVLREVSSENLLDDAIRIFRAFRFYSTLGLQFSESLSELLKNNFRLIETVAMERVNAELVKLFGGKNVVNSIYAMDEYGILELLLPEVSEIKKIPPNSHHHLCLIEHSIETVRQIQNYYDKSASVVKEHLDSEFLGGQKRIAYLKFAAFLHDVGKPSTWHIEPDTGRHRFIMHDAEGAKIIVPTLKKLKFSNKQILYIQKMIKNHIYPAGLVTSADAGEKAYLRFVRKIGDEVIDLIALAYADRMSALGVDITMEMVNKNIGGLQNLLDFYIEQRDKIAPLPKLLDGKEIMELLGIPPSKKLGQIVEQLKEAQLSSDVVTKEDAIRFVKKLDM